MKCNLPALLLAGIAAGMALSDAATLLGLPQGKHLLELRYHDSPERLFTCTKLASALGENLSTFDPDTPAASTPMGVSRGVWVRTLGLVAWGIGRRRWWSPPGSLSLSRHG